MSDDSTPSTDPDRPTAYGLNKYPMSPRSEAEDRKRIREEYGWLRGYYKARPEAYRDLQRTLNQARMGVNYDVYLAQSAWYVVASVIVGIFLGLLLTVSLIDMGILAEFRNPLTYRGDLTRYLGANRAWFAGAALIIVMSSLLSTIVWYTRYYLPSFAATSRRRNIDVTLPHAIVMMYALSYSGLNTAEIIDILADSQDTYGEVANEFQMVHRDLTLFGNDLYTALRNTRDLTVSDNLEQFIDDMLSVLDAGGDLTAFYENEVDTYLEEARDEQEQFIETLGILSEFFIALFVAAPLFVIVILIVISLLGGQTLGQLQLLVYAALPLGMAGFIVLLDTLSEPYEQPVVQSTEHDARTASLLGDSPSLFVAFVKGEIGELFESQPASAATDGGYDIGGVVTEGERTRISGYLRKQRRKAMWEAITNPMRPIRRKPVLSLLVTVPLAIAYLGAVLATGTVDASLAVFVEDPLWSTTMLAIVPLFVAVVPLSLLHERRARKERRIAMRFPEVLNVLSSANRMGIKFVDALGLVSRWSSGPLADQLEIVRNDIRWNYDIHRALERLSTRLQSPQLSRTIRLIGEGTRASRDLARVLSIAAEDTRDRFKIERKRRSELATYIAVVVIGFLVYLMVIVLLDASYLQPIEDAATGADTTGERGLPLSLGNIPVQTYQAIFFHSALIQAFGIGLISGKLTDNSTLSGLKYSIVLIVVTILVFLFV